MSINYDEFFNDLASNSSRNYKISKLKENYNDETLRRILSLTLDPFTQFYQRKIPKYSNSDNPSLTIDQSLDMLFPLSNREVTGNKAIEYLSKLLSNLSISDSKVIERIISKDLKCGVSTSTVNSVWSSLIPEYPCMLCSPFEDKLIKKIKFPAYVQEKSDGMRFNAIVDDGKCEFRSRNGKEIDLLGNLSKEFISMANGMSVVFDGELLVKSNDGSFLPRKESNGILNKANKGTINDSEASKVVALVWDMIPYIYFIEGLYNKPYTERFNNLKSAIEEVSSDCVILSENILVNTIDEAKIIFDKKLSEGKEGIILKDSNGIWENKRAKHQIKFKAELECDLVIKNIKEGTGKYEGMVGAIECESSDGVIKVSVGSGFSDDQRKNFDSSIIGKIAAIKYNERIKSVDGSESLFLPILIEIREDKEVADSSTNIK